MHFAEINPLNNKVLRVIVSDSQEWCEKHLGGTWKRTYYATPPNNYAGVGFTYHPDKDNFSAPQPFASWALDAHLQWQPPVPYPDPTGTSIVFEWNESTQSWTVAAKQA